ncbi:hypothetical protein ABPH35_07360 [Streptococcus sp. ZJ93]|uniref:hypothetical protein n=1 Tax=Streptococcus handemini TaxID=3161188 RepID=UPI0032EB419E
MSWLAELIGELLIGVILDWEAKEFRSPKSLVLYAICRNLFHLALIALFVTLIWYTTYQGGWVNYFFALICLIVLLFQIGSFYSWNKQAIKHWQSTTNA